MNEKPENAVGSSEAPVPQSILSVEAEKTEAIYGVTTAIYAIVP
jgi:hypothetical protein